MSIHTFIKLLQKTEPDRSRFFVPEAYTPLFFTRFYPDLSRAEKLRYNQLVGLSYNEQFIFYETSLSRHMLTTLLENPRFKSLHETVRSFRDDELAHARLFQALNRCYEPEWYRDSDLYFIRMPRQVLRLWHFFARRPDWFPFILWLVSILEERGAYLARGLLDQKEELEPLMVEAHRLHLADEAEHFDYDDELLDQFWTRNKPWIRSVNARLFQTVYSEFFIAPKRTGLRILDAWLDSFPAWQPHRNELRDELLLLGRDPDYVRTLYGPEVIPNARGRMASQPEFQKTTALWSLLELHRTVSATR